MQILAVEAGIEDAAVMCAGALPRPGGLCGEDGQPSGGRAKCCRKASAPVRICRRVSDDSPPKAERKRQQVEHAAHVPHGAKLIKLADKTANLRDLVDFPPVDWAAYRRREYFDWAALVVGLVRGTHAGLEELFDAAHARRPD